MFYYYEFRSRQPLTISGYPQEIRVFSCSIYCNAWKFHCYNWTTHCCGQALLNIAISSNIAAGSFEPFGTFYIAFFCASLPPVVFSYRMQSHASRHIASEFLKDRHPDFSPPCVKVNLAVLQFCFSCCSFYVNCVKPCIEVVLLGMVVCVLFQYVCCT